MVPPVELCRGFSCRHFLLIAFEWITDGQKKTSWHTERTNLQCFVGKDLQQDGSLRRPRVGLAAAAWPKKPAACGDGVRGWREWPGRKECFHLCGTFYHVECQIAPCPKGSGPDGDVVLWGLGTEMFWVCPALRGTKKSCIFKVR